MAGCLYELRGGVYELRQGEVEPTTKREWSGLKYIQPNTAQTRFSGWFATALYSPDGETDLTITVGEGAQMHGVREINNPGETPHRVYLTYEFFPLRAGEAKSLTFSRHCWETIVDHLLAQNAQNVGWALSEWLRDQSGLAPTAVLYPEAFEIVTKCAGVWIDARLWPPSEVGLTLAVTDDMGNAYNVEALPEGSGWQAVAYQQTGEFPTNYVAHSAYPSGRGAFATQAEAIGACVANLAAWITRDQ
jgi:hypothetical protein